MQIGEHDIAFNGWLSMQDGSLEHPELINPPEVSPAELKTCWT